MKILALDLGDKWVGSAISDPLGITCKPLKTVELDNLKPFLKDTLSTQPISIVVVGYPKTFSGTESDQTKKIVKLKEELELEFSNVNFTDIKWILWDERLSSKRALEIQSGKYDPESKRQNHSLAAAFILQNYLDHLAFNKN
ncbi:MAG: Holliday junction resolvase RuvX [Candidatus Babeliales bacterium]|jgi:putative Holliday junction resolvase